MSYIKDAKEITDLIFKEEKIYSYKIIEYPYLLTLYSDVYRFFSLKKVSGTFKYYNYSLSKFKSYIINSPIYFTAFLYSIFSFFLLLTKKRKIAIWSGDFYNIKTKSDFRLGNLILELENSKINYFEIIRLRNVGYGTFFSNLFKRRRPVIYYDCLEPLLHLFKKDVISINITKLNNEENNFLSNFFSNHVQEKNMFFILKFIFKKLKITKFIPWEVSYRQIYPFLASKNLNIETLGFMHGLSFNTYMSYEHISYSKKKFSPDIFIVWSEFWKKYFNDQSNNYSRLESWGYLRNNHLKNKLVKNKNKKKNILFITEPLIDVDSIYPYIKKIVSNSNFNIIFKLRDQNCFFYNKLIDKYPELTKIKTKTGLYSESLKNIDIVIGSHSTAIIESTIFEIPFAVLNTRKWGDYFEISKDFPNNFILSPDELEDKISLILNGKFNHTLFKNKYFGDNNSLNKILDWIKKK